MPKVLGPTELSNSFLGNLVQVCVFTRDYRRTLEGFINLGVGPWTIRTVDSSKNIEVIYRDLPADFSVKLCLANSQNMNWEIIEPLRGRSIYADSWNGMVMASSTLPSVATHRLRRARPPVRRARLPVTAARRHLRRHRVPLFCR
ncbi:hypothetical protein FJ434_27380 [Mesorhizobium sp. B2-5-13]|uniref:VOC family protein n=1 Tax=unclassified Mesorhizobium TaxID=325217 RepID=UPI0011274530|nr:hypothetical protein FJ434_27380 [Mesorhizobium sp. B2-5-13]